MKTGILTQNGGGLQVTPEDYHDRSFLFCKPIVEGSMGLFSLGVFFTAPGFWQGCVIPDART
jgi:hypothetical protein